MPDNLTRAPDGIILAAGIEGINGNSPPQSNYPRMQSFVLAEVDPKTMKSRILYANNGKALINGASVAMEAGDAFYVGSFQGKRLLNLPR